MAKHVSFRPTFQGCHIVDNFGLRSGLRSFRFVYSGFSIHFLLSVEADDPCPRKMTVGDRADTDRRKFDFNFVIYNDRTSHFCDRKKLHVPYCIHTLISVRIHRM